VVVRLHALNSYTLTSYVLRDWKTKIKAASKTEVGDVEIFLKDLRHHSRKQDYGETFFEGMEDLNVGPVRAFASGSCSIQDLDAIIQTSFDELHESSSWREHFDKLDNDALI
jgi:hypothetical protein